MFTGIVEERGEVVAVDRHAGAATVTVRGPRVTADAAHGDSIAVNGVCLTVTAISGSTFTADIMAETLRRTALGALAPGSPVNLERPLCLGGRLGGHLVQGHVDGVGRILTREPADEWEVLTFALPPELARYVVEKGSITVDGVSLTVTRVDDETFSVGLIPTTLKLTTLGHKRAGDPVNVEVDVIAKYVERLLS
jgi:riboflavin synthase